MKYVQLIETKDDLSELSVFQKFLLCASIIETPSYQKKGLKFDVDTTSYDKDSFKYVEKPLSFMNGKYAGKKLPTNCITCEAYLYGENKERVLMNLFLTRSYSDKHSVITLIGENEEFYLDKSFKNISLLINAHDRATKDIILDSEMDQ